MNHARFRIAAAAALLLLFAPLHAAGVNDDPAGDSVDRSEPRTGDSDDEEKTEHGDDEQADTERPAMPIPIPGVGKSDQQEGPIDA